VADLSRRLFKTIEDDFVLAYLGIFKLYVNEPDRGLVFDRLGSAEGVAVSRIAWVEAHAALARRAREEPQDIATIESAKHVL
jgi:uncharacterized protein